MKPFRSLTAVEQLAAHLRAEILAGSMGSVLPGINRLAKELAVSPKTVIAAVAQLEHEGLLRGQGERRRIQVLAKPENPKPKLRVALLLYEPTDRAWPYQAELLYRLQDSGHDAFFTDKTLIDLGLDVNRVASYVEKTNADAWVIAAGTREILEWFTAHEITAFSEFGRPGGLPIASIGVWKNPALSEALRNMYQLGHRRIVMIARMERIKPKPAIYEQLFLDELESLGIKTGPYHLPEWEQSIEGLHRCVDSLFMHTPPTLMIISEPELFISIKDYLSQKGIIAPRDVSLICDDPCHMFRWCSPPISHLRWDTEPIVRRVVRWVNKVSRGVVDKRQGYTMAEFVEGGTCGPPPKGKISYKM